MSNVLTSSSDEIDVSLNGTDRVYVAATFTAEPAAATIQFWLERLGLSGKVEFAPYNQVFQQLLDPESALARNPSGCNVIIIRWGDLTKFSASQAVDLISKDLRQKANDLISALSARAALSPVPYLFVVAPSLFDSTPAFAPIIEHLENDVRLALHSQANVYAIFPGDIATSYPVDRWHDAGSERLGHVPFTGEYFTALGTTIIRRIASMRMRPRKVIVLDCDNTLWSGVCAEDGALGVRITGPFRALQEFMVRQSGQGKLLCLCSKNTERDVWKVFEAQSSMPLSKENLVGWRINWESKADNLKSLAKELSLGIDSFIFIDDNPIECAEVQAACPEALTLCLPRNADQILAFLSNWWSFDQCKVTEADKQRAASYRLNAGRNELLNSAASLADFIEMLDLQIEITPAKPSEIERIAQLSQRVNQFNTTNTRLSEGEVSTFCAKPNNHCLAVRVRDRFGDYGLVGCSLAVPRDQKLEVLSLLLSCRALGRGVEHALLAALGRIALDLDCSFVELPFVRSARNQPALNFLESVRPARHLSEEGRERFVLQAAAAAQVRFEPSNAAPVPHGEHSPGPTPVSSQAWPSHQTLQWIAEEMTSVAAIRAAMAKTARPRPAVSQPFLAPSSADEKLVAQVFREVLGLREIGVLDNFIELGGTSVQLVQIHSRLRELMGVDLDITALFQHPTAASLARSLGERDQGSRMAMIKQRALRQRNALDRMRKGE